MTPGWPPFSYEDSGVWEEAVLSQAAPGCPLVSEVLVILWSWFLIVKGTCAGCTERGNTGLGTRQKSAVILLACGWEALLS